MGKIRYTGSVPVEDAHENGALILPKQIVERPDERVYNYTCRSDFDPADKATQKVHDEAANAVAELVAAERGNPTPEPVSPAETVEV